IASSYSDPHVCGLRLDRQVECWGRNRVGQVGQTDTSANLIDPVHVPYIVPGLANCTAIAAAALTSCAICAGEASGWGSNFSGSVGAGEPPTNPVTVPRQLAHLDGDPWVDLRSGSYHSCARSQSGRVFCWGSSSHGGLGSGIGANLPVTVRATPPP